MSDVVASLGSGLAGEGQERRPGLDGVSTRLGRVNSATERAREWWSGSWTFVQGSVTGVGVSVRTAVDAYAADEQAVAAMFEAKR